MIAGQTRSLVLLAIVAVALPGCAGRVSEPSPSSEPAATAPDGDDQARKKGLDINVDVGQDGVQVDVNEGGVKVDVGEDGVQADIGGKDD